jgi:type IV pilus assembly protein PilM
MFAKNRSLVGLDLGLGAVKAVELTERGGAYAVTGFGQIECAAEDAESRARAVQELFREGSFKTRRVAVGVSGKQVIVRYLALPRMQGDELRNAAAFEAGKYVPFPLEECVMDVKPMDLPQDRAGEGNQTALFVAARRAQIDEQLDLIEKAGLVAEVVDVDAFALGNALELGAAVRSEEERRKTIALIDVGASKTCLNIVSDGTSLFTREIYVAGRDFTQAVARRMNLAAQDAEDFKRAPQEEQTLREAVLPVVDDLAHEIQISFDYFENQFERRIDELRLAGGGSRLGALAEAFERVFERPAKPFNPFEGADVDGAVDRDLLESNAGRFAVAAGLAARLRRS